MNEFICEKKMIIRLLQTTMVDSGNLGRTSIQRIAGKNWRVRVLSIVPCILFMLNTPIFSLNNEISDIICNLTQA